MHNTLKLIFGVSSLLFLAIGAAFMFAPSAVLELFALNPASAENPELAWSTVRGDMGGLFLSLGTAMGLGAMTGNKTWIYAAMVMMGTVFIGRAFGVVLHGGDRQVFVNMGAEALYVTLMGLFSRGLD